MFASIPYNHTMPVESDVMYSTVALYGIWNITVSGNKLGRSTQQQYPPSERDFQEQSSGIYLAFNVVVHTYFKLIGKFYRVKLVALLSHNPQHLAHLSRRERSLVVRGETQFCSLNLVTKVKSVTVSRLLLCLWGSETSPAAVWFFCLLVTLLLC